MGRVKDVFISKKARKNSKPAFGFVRYGTPAEAVDAIGKLNGHFIKKMKLSVSMAKYNKAGTSFQQKNNYGTGMRKTIKNTSFRDARQYKEVLLGKNKTVSKPEKNKNVTIDSNLNEMSPLVSFTIKASENAIIT